MPVVGFLAQQYSGAGVVDMSLNVYPDARHGVFNETNRDKITADVIWLGSHVR